MSSGEGSEELGLPPRCFSSAGGHPDSDSMSEEDGPAACERRQLRLLQVTCLSSGLACCGRGHSSFWYPRHSYKDPHSGPRPSQSRTHQRWLLTTHLLLFPLTACPPHSKPSRGARTLEGSRSPCAVPTSGPLAGGSLFSPRGREKVRVDVGRAWTALGL